VRLRIVGRELPGRSFHDVGYSDCRWDNVHVGVQRKREVIDLVPGDADQAVFDLDITVRPGRDGRPDHGGPVVHGRPNERFVYLSWGAVGDDGSFEMFRRIKLWLRGLDPELLDAATQEGRRLQVELSLTDCRGGPRCGGIKPDAVSWSAVEDDAVQRSPS
jgi:hypothetical protein